MASHCPNAHFNQRHLWRSLLRSGPLTWTVLLWVVAQPLVWTAPASAQITAEKANKAIDRGVAFLKNQFKVNNNRWPEYAAVPGGIPALCTLALLQSGLPPEDPVVQQSLEQLRAMDNLQMVYARSLVTMALCAAEPKRDRLQIQQHVKWLEEAQVQQGNHQGGWSYNSGQTTSDPSNSQFALMGLHEAEQVGIEVDSATFQRALDYWLKRQDPAGGWRYQSGIPPSLSMTCAGISSLVIASGKLGNGDSRIVNNRVECCSEQADEEPLQRGINYLGKKL